MTEKRKRGRPRKVKPEMTDTEAQVEGAAAEAEETAPESGVKVTCTDNNLYLGDGRKLEKGESAQVSEAVAEMLKEFDNVEIG